MMLASIPALPQDEARKQNTKLVNELIVSIPDTVAEISGRKIPKAYLIEEIMPLIRKLKQNDKALTVQDMDKVEEAAKKSLGLLIERELLFALAEKNSCTASQEEIDAQFAKIAGAVQGGSKALVADMGVNENSIKRKIGQGIAIEKWMQRKFIPGFTPTAKEVEDFYRNSQNIFLIPEKAAISHIFVSSESMDDKKAAAKLESLRTAAKTAELFRKTAKESSQDDKTRDNGGALGEFTPSELPKPFADAIAKLSPGQISAPFKSLRGWHIVRLDARTEAKYVPTAEAYPVIKKYLAEKKATSKLSELIESEKKRCGCRIFWN